MAKFRILSLDGGGTWALIQVMALQAVYSANAKGHDILKDFDLVAANSGGSITLGGLIENLTLDEVLNGFFLNEGKRKQIFTPTSIGEDFNNLLFKGVGLAPRYQTKPKLAAFKKLLPKFGNLSLASIPGKIAQAAGKCPHFVITSFNYDLQRAMFFRSNLKSAAASSAHPANPTLAEAMHASSTAPVVYYDEPAELGTLRFWDGGVAGYNNPVLGAVVEALAAPIPATEIQALSIGTGTIRLPISGTDDDNSGLTTPPQESSIPNNLRKLAGSILDDPPDAASFVSHVVLGQQLPDAAHPAPISGSVIRMNPVVRPIVGDDGSLAPPDGLSLDDFVALTKLELDAVEPEQVSKIQQLCKLWLADKVPNQPIRANSDNYYCEIGHAKFSQAKAAWDQLPKV